MAALLFLPEQPVVALRRAVLAHGYQPISIYNWDARCNSPGKHAFGNNWGETKGLPPLSTEALNTGIICKNLRAIDVDIDDPKMAATAVALAEETIGRTSLVRFRSNSPRRLLLYRGVRKKLVIGKSYRDADGRKKYHWKVEILGDGQQFVAFGTHHSGAELQWEGDSPADFSYDDLPELLSDAEDRYAEALRDALGADREDEPQAVQSAAVSTVSSSGDNVSEWARTAFDAEVSRVANSPQGGRNDDLNRAAFSLGQIVAGGYLGEAEVTAALRSAAISCGLVRDDKWPSVMATIRSGLSKGKLDPRKKPEHAIEVPYAVVEAAEGMVEKAKAKSPAPKDPLASVTLGHNVDWTQPAGLLKEMVEWILQTSRRPNRPLAVAAATAVLSTVCGRHLYSATGTAMNVYIACLAETAVGKDRPFSAVAEILHAAGMGRLQTTAKAFSVSGFEQLIVETPGCVASVDEMGTSLLARISHRNASSHEASIKSFLQELWSRVRGKAPFLTTRRATSAPVEVHSPSLTIFGASTPEAFFESLTAGNVLDGFMNRFLLAPAAPRAPKANTVEMVPVPQVIVDSLTGIVPELDGNLGGLLGVFAATTKVVERQLAWAGDDVAEAADALEESVLNVMDAKPQGYQLLGRVFEYAVRLAGIHAVSRGGVLAKIEMPDLEWGASWAMTSARSMIEAARTLMASNEHEANVNKIEAVIREAGTIGRREVLRRVRSIKANDRDSILEQLKGAELIVEEEVKRGGAGAPGRRYRWIG